MIMMLRNLLAGMIILIAAVSNAQDRYFTKTGNISFHSKADLENIDAYNRTVTCVLDTKTGAVQLSTLMKGFEFQKALMQEHFNEKYVESDRFPKGEFKGQITNNSSIDYTKDGSYPANVKGQLTIHGVTKDIETNGTVNIKNGKPQAVTSFNITLSDYNISIPALVKDKLSNSINIKVNCSLEPLK